MAEELRADGWEVVTVRAGHVAPKAPAEGETDRFGFVYLAQGEDADPLETAIEQGTFDAYELFTNRTGRNLFAVTRVTDTDSRLAVLLVGTIDLDQVGELATVARERGVMFSHVQLLDGTHLGSFRHENPEAFFPEDR
jgi:hypothetical protein